MANKLWRYGKKLTLWGALVSSLPFLFLSLMVLLVLGITLAVPLGCAVGSYVCFKKLYGGLCRKRLIACKNESSGLKQNEAELDVPSHEVEGGDENEEIAERAFELEGHSQLQSEAREVLDNNDPHGEPETCEEEKPHWRYEEKIHQSKPLEEAHPLKLYESEIQSKWDPFALSSAEGGRQAPEEETHLRHKDELKVSEGEAQLTWNPDDNIVEYEAEGGDENEEIQQKVFELVGNEVEGGDENVESAELVFEVEGADENEESAEMVFEVKGHSQVQYKEVQCEAGEDCNKNDPHGEPEIYEEEKPYRSYEEKIHEVKPLEEEPHHLLDQGETESKWDLHALPSAERGGQTPDGETHLRYKDEVQIFEEDELTWGPHTNIVGEEQIAEHETYTRLKDEVKGSETEAQSKWDPCAEGGQAPEGETHLRHKDEVKVSEGEVHFTWYPHFNIVGETQLRHKDEVKVSEGEAHLTSYPYVNIVEEEEISEDETHYRTEDEMKVSEGESQLRLDPQAIPMEKTAAEEQIPKDDIQFTLKEEVKASEGETQMTSENHHAIAVEEEEERSSEIQEISTKRSCRKQGAESDSENLSAIDTKHQRRDLEEDEEEKSSEMQEISSRTPYHEQRAELDLEKPSSTDTTNKRREEDEEEDEEGENSIGLQGIPSKRSSHKQGAEPDLDKFSPTDTKHKRTEEEDEEQEESTQVREIPSKRSYHQQDTELELAPATPYTDNTIRDGMPATPETTYYSAAQSIQAESPHKASFLGFECDAASRVNDATDIEFTTSLEVQVSSGSESDQDSKSASESTPGRDLDDGDDIKIWEEIHAVRKIVGYKEDPHPSYTEEIKALYVFTGVEPPASLKYSFDLIKAKDKLRFLKIVVGVK